MYMGTSIQILTVISVVGQQSVVHVYMYMHVHVFSSKYSKMFPSVPTPS